MQILQDRQQLVALHMFESRPAHNAIDTRMAIRQARARRDGLKRQRSRDTAHAQLLAGNARQFGVFPANIDAMNGSSAVTQHQRQIGNAIAAAKI